MGKPRIESANGHYHVHGRGQGELRIFSNDCDKLYFISLLEERSKKYNFTIHSFAIMDTHYHFSGMDNDKNLSKMMQSILTSYAMYYNKKYLHKGHVFRERFTSRPLYDSYDVLTITRYIHRNPKDIQGYLGKEELYKFSSYGKYVGKETILNKFVDYSLVMTIVSASDVASFNKKYFDFVKLNLKS